MNNASVAHPAGGCWAEMSTAMRQLWLEENLVKFFPGVLKDDFWRELSDYSPTVVTKVCAVAFDHGQRMPPLEMLRDWVTAIADAGPLPGGSAENATHIWRVLVCKGFIADSATETTGVAATMTEATTTAGAAPTNLTGNATTQCADRLVAGLRPLLEAKEERISQAERRATVAEGDLAAANAEIAALNGELARREATIAQLRDQIVDVPEAIRLVLQEFGVTK